MELHRTDEGFALYKEKTQIGFCALTPAAKGAAITAFGIEPQWRRKGYGSYLLKEALRAYAGYDREKATVFTAPLPADAAELAFWAKFGFAAEGRKLPLHPPGSIWSSWACLPPGMSCTAKATQTFYRLCSPARQMR